MDMEIFPITEEGYKSLIDFQSWRVAGICYAERFDIKNLYRMEKHIETDEVFILLKGSAWLLTASKEKTIKTAEIKIVKMEAEKAYCICQNVWHHIVVDVETSVLIVENSDTCFENTDYYEFSLDQIRYIQKQF